MLLQCIAIALLMVFPQIATYLPEQLREDAAAAQVEQVDDSQNRLEEDPLKQKVEEVPEPETPEKAGSGNAAQEKRPDNASQIIA